MNYPRAPKAEVAKQPISKMPLLQSTKLSKICEKTCTLPGQDFPTAIKAACNQQGPPGLLEPGRSLLTALAVPLGTTCLKSVVNIAITPIAVKGGSEVFFRPRPRPRFSLLCAALFNPVRAPWQAAYVYRSK